MKQIYQAVPLPWTKAESTRKGRILLLSPAYNAHIVAPHLGLGYLAAVLRQAGHSVVLLDGLREKIRYGNDFDLVGISAMSTYFPEAVELAKAAKARGLKVIIGGPHIIADPKGSLIQSGADYACAGEGELILTALANGANPRLIPGLLWKEGDQIHQNGEANFLPTVDDFGEPDWELIDPRTYPPAPHGMIARAFPLAPMVTTRGCPYSCTYCSAPITAGKKMRFRNPKLVVDEMEKLVRTYGVREIQIEDDNFTIKRDHVLAICDEILSRNLKVHWSLPNGVRIDRLDKPMLKEMKKAGCYLMALGIESANQRILDLVEKRLDVSLVRQVTQDVVDAGIEAWGFFMVGFPTETRQEILNTVEFALSLPLTRCQFTRTTPLPGTPIYEWWKSEWGKGKEIDWSTFNYYSFETNWSEVSSQELGQIQRKAHARFYLRPKNFIRIVKSIRPLQYKYILRRLLNLSSFRSDNMRKVAGTEIIAEPVEQNQKRKAS